ncbi:MAG: hypothetical protein GY715_01335 [Planctomycetes bacterium]|nr:hypothetical protein [Planctomycetota bacterium]
MTTPASIKTAATVAMVSVCVLALPPDAPGQVPGPAIDLRPIRLPRLEEQPIILSSEEEPEDGDFEAEYIVRLYEEEGCSNADEFIEFRVWLDEGSGEYKLDVGFQKNDFWDRRISSVGPDGNDNYPAVWSLYADSYCSDHLESGTGEKDQVDHNDEARSCRARVSSNRDWCWFYAFEGSNQRHACMPFKLYKHGNTSNVVLELSCLDTDFWNDRPSSIETTTQGGGTCTWTFYKDDNYDGQSMQLSEEQTADDLGSMDNEITSIKLVIDD